MADLHAFDALILLSGEALPHAPAALSASALEKWVDSLPTLAGSAVQDALDDPMPQAKRCRAVLSHIPRCVPVVTKFSHLHGVFAHFCTDWLSCSGVPDASLACAHSCPELLGV